MKNLNKIFKINLQPCIAFVMFLVSCSCMAQDTIVTRSGKTILGNVMEVTTTEVKYKKMELADGPVYIENKSSIEKIKYKNGYTDVFQQEKSPETIVKTDKNQEETDYRRKITLEPRGRKYVYGDKLLSENQMHKMLLGLNNPEITRAVRGAKADKGLQYIGFAAIPLMAIGAIALGFSTDAWGAQPSEQEALRNVGIGFLASGTIILGTSIYFKIDRKRKNALAVGLYKKQYE